MNIYLPLDKTTHMQHSCSLMARYLPADYFDTYSCRIPQSMRISPAELLISVFAEPPRWIRLLMKLRNALVKPFGFDAHRFDKATFAEALAKGESYLSFSFPVKTDNEVIMCSDEHHLTFYLSVCMSDDSICLSTAVKYKTRFGRIYFRTIKRFHKWIVRSMVERIEEEKMK